MIIYKLRSLTVEVRGCCWNSEGIVVIIIVVIEAMLLLLLLSLTILVLTNRLLSGFFYPGTQRHTVWYATCRLTLGFKEIRACLVFQFLYFLFSKLLEIFFSKNYIWNQFSKHSFHLICVWLLFFKTSFQEEKTKNCVWLPFWKQILISLKETTYSVASTNFRCIYGTATKFSSQF